MKQYCVLLCPAPLHAGIDWYKLDVSSLNLRVYVCVCLLTVYMEGFFIAASNLPGNIFTILMMDSTGGKALLCECHVLFQCVLIT